VDVGRRAAAAFPDAAEAIQEITRRYVEQRYGRSPASSREFIRAVSRLPRLRPPSEDHGAKPAPSG
jgi:hypothetical protein